MTTGMTTGKTTVKTTRTKTALLLILAFGLTGCVGVGQAPSELIVGGWQTTVGNFPLTVTYGENTVQLGGAEPVSYQLDGDRLTYADGSQQVRIVSFPDSSMMQQLDPLTGIEQVYTRIVP